MGRLMEKWEPITSREQEVGYYDSLTERLKVFDGWIVRSTDSEHGAQCMTFVPDEDHYWEIEPEPEKPETKEEEVNTRRGALK